jgi:hypothetical protein
MVDDLAADVALARVVVRAEAGIAHAGLDSSLWQTFGWGVPARDQGFALTAFAGQPPVAGAFAGLGAADRHSGVPLHLVHSSVRKSGSGSRMGVGDGERPDMIAVQEGGGTRAS